MLDIRSACCCQSLAGIASQQITIDQTCTYLSEEGFSYRQDKTCGRHVSFIMRKSF
ncbi:laccase domain-containing protein [Lysinibacillus tabacifolii]|uniref:Laccase domain-containing protein n=1 Tax=Lysinibacillus tabacifolii TaxID=1173107 RepID=A0ABY2T3W5_9BACI|nr:laccase domain-containing protein [Lysinibacillus tabacifolii]